MLVSSDTAEVYVLCLDSKLPVMLTHSREGYKYDLLTQWLMKFLTKTAGAKDLAGFIPAPV